MSIKPQFKRRKKKNNTCTPNKQIKNTRKLKKKERKNWCCFPCSLPHGDHTNWGDHQVGAMGDITPKTATRRCQNLHILRNKLLCFKLLRFWAC